MKLVKPSLVSIVVVSLLGCSTTTDTQNSNKQKLYTQTEMDLMLAKAKSQERARIEKELNRQQDQRDLFNQIREHQNNLQKNKENIKTAENKQKLNKDSEENSASIEKIIPTSRKPAFYREIKGVKYYRCAANSLVAVEKKNNHWYYDSSHQELSATLCKKSRNFVTMKKLQQTLYDQGLLTSDTLTKEQLVDGVWGNSTLEAVKKYQQNNGLLFGQLTIQTLEHLGVFTPNTVKPDSMQGLNIIKPSVEIANVEEATADANSATDNQNSQVALEPKVAESQPPAVPAVAKVEEVQETNSAIKAKPVEPKLQSNNASQNTDLVKVIEKIIPKNRKQHLYKIVSGADYYRCAANSLVPQKSDFGNWAYSSEKQELSATLCKRSRDVATMTDLQYILNEKGYLTSPTLTKGQLISGVWGQDTLSAVKKYQRKNGLLYGQLTIETLERLGVFEADKNRVKWVAKNSNELKANNDAQAVEATQTATQTAAQKQPQTDVEDMPEVAPILDDQPNASIKAPVASESNSVNFTPFVVAKKQDDDIDYSLLQPQVAKPVFYAKLEDGTALWRCRAHAFLASKDSEGLISYDDDSEYRATLCKMSRSKAIIKQLQLALKEKGYLKPSPPLDLVVIDGIWGINTLGALKNYQRANGLAYGQLSIESLEKLGVFKSQ